MFKSVGKTDIGLKRNVNQDYFKLGNTSRASWAIVCDGLGGEKAGEVASKLATKEISKHIENYYSSEMSFDDIKKVLVTALNIANSKIFDISQEDKECEGMATTAIVSLIVDGHLHIAHVGDSRIYLVRDGAVDQLTKDDSLVQALIENGTLSEAEAKNHPQRNCLTKAIGVEKDVDVRYNCFEISEKDVILMCSDGLYNYVDEKTILENLGAEKLTAEKCHCLTDKFVNMALDGGGNDNITVVIMFDDYYGHESGV